MSDTNTSIDVTRGPIARQLVQLSIPIFFSSFFQQAYSLCNTFVLGRFGGKFALGGVQATLVLNDLAVGFCVGMGAGCAVIAGQHFGSHDDDGLKTSVHTALCISFVLGIASAILGVIFARRLLMLMETPESLLAEAVTYSRCYFAGMVFSLVMNMGVALLRAVGDTRGPALIVASGCAINVCLDLVFVAGLGLEALGCGIATCMTMAINCSMVLLRMAHARGPWRLDIKALRIDAPTCKAMLICGLPLGLQSSAYSISNIVVQSSINTFGADATTGTGLYGRVSAFPWLVMEAVGMATTTFAAQNFGARNIDRLRKGCRVSIFITVVVMGTLSLLLYVFIEPLVRFFIDDDSIVGYAVMMGRIAIPFMVFCSVADNLSGLIRGTGESFKPMLLTLAGTCVFRVIWIAVLMPAHHQFELLLAVYPVSWIFTCTMFIVYYKRGRWLSSRLASAE